MCYYEFSKRKDEKDEFLKWVSLPSKQLKKNNSGISHVDEIYAQAEQMLTERKGDQRPLVVLGIGGSKHTVEFLKNMANAQKGRILFYSDIDPLSYSTLKEELGGSFRNANYLVVSKSGSTFETKDAYLRVLKDIANEYRMSENMTELEIEKNVENHFAVCTDKNAEKSDLRRWAGEKNGVGNTCIKELYIHDDVGGRFSMFDDAGLFALAYAGVPKEFVERMLTAAKETSKNCLNLNILKNDAAKSAVFNVHAGGNGTKISTNQYFGKVFENGGENWLKQLYLESLKDFQFSVGKAPDAMHYASEGLFHGDNYKKYFMTMTTLNQDISENYRKYTKAIGETYSEIVPTKMEILDTENGAIKPEAIGKYIQTKMFETVYTGMLRRQMYSSYANSKKAIPEALPEVLQPSVETYKKNFKPGSNNPVIPGE